MTQKELSSKEAQQRELQTDGLIERIFGCAPGTPRKMPTTPAEWREDILQRTRAQIGMMAERGDKVSQALIPHTITHLANMMTHLGREMEHDKQLEEIMDGINSLKNANGKPRRRRTVSMKEACAILEKLNCPVNRRTITRWINGQNTPDGFTPEKMESIEAFTAWAKIHANREQSKINSNNALHIDSPNNDRMKKFR